MLLLVTVWFDIILWSVYNFTYHVNIKSFCVLSYAAIMVSLIGYTYFPGMRGAAYAIQLKLFLLCANRRQVWTDFFANISHNHKKRQKQKKTWPILTIIWPGLYCNHCHLLRMHLIGIQKNLWHVEWTLVDLKLRGYAIGLNEF